MPTAPAAFLRLRIDFIVVSKLLKKFLIGKAKYWVVLLNFGVYLVHPSIVAADFLKVVAPAEILIETQFEINLEISEQPNTSYFVKARISNDQTKWSSGQTLDETKNVWLSDTVAWTSFPSFTTDNSGHWVGRIYARATKNALLGTNFLVVRIHTGNNNLDSATYTIKLKEAPKESPETLSPTTVENKGQPILNEFLPQPNSGNKEWVEIRNKGTGNADVSGWKIDDEAGKSSPQVIPNGSVIPPGGFLVITFESPKLNDLTDSVRLLKSDDSVVESYTYQNSIKGQSFAKDQNGNWFSTAVVSPNASNPIAPNVLGTSQNSSSLTAINQKPATADSTDPKTFSVSNKLPEVRGSQEQPIATVSASFSKKSSNKFNSLPLIILGTLLLISAGVLLIKRKIKSGHSETAEQPLKI